MKKEIRLLLDRSSTSLTLSIELFNRPTDVGRVEGVLLALDHAFEMLLKAAILHRGGKIRAPRSPRTHGFDKCVRIAVSDATVRFLTDEQALVLQSINEYRDAAQHYLIDIPEEILYLQAQSGLTLFRDILRDVFELDLIDQLPVRVLPISTRPLRDMVVLFDRQTEEIRRLFDPATRRRTEGISRLRSLAILDRAIAGEATDVSDGQLRRIGEQLRAGDDWRDLFPGAAAVNFVAEGSGPEMTLRVTKQEGIPTHYVPEGTPGAAVVGVRRVNELDHYSLAHRALADLVALTSPKLSALIWRLDLKADDAAAKEFRLGSVAQWRYSPAGLERVRAALTEVDIDEVWTEYQARRR